MLWSCWRWRWRWRQQAQARRSTPSAGASPRRLKRRTRHAECHRVYAWPCARCWCATRSAFGRGSAAAAPHARRACLCPKGENVSPPTLWDACKFPRRGVGLGLCADLAASSRESVTGRVCAMLEVTSGGAKLTSGGFLSPWSRVPPPSVAPCCQRRACRRAAARNERGSDGGAAAQVHDGGAAQRRGSGRVGGQDAPHHRARQQGEEQEGTYGSLWMPKWGGGMLGFPIAVCVRAWSMKQVRKNKLMKYS